MTTYTSVVLPLYPDYFYEYSISLQEDNDVYVIEIQYNDYSKKWYMSLYTEDRMLLVAGLPLLPKYPIAVDYIIPNLTGFFWLYPIPSITSEKYQEDPEALSQYYKFEYIPALT